jgi:hypothetical protein
MKHRRALLISILLIAIFTAVLSLSACSRETARGTLKELFYLDIPSSWETVYDNTDCDFQGTWYLLAVFRAKEDPAAFLENFTLETANDGNHKAFFELFCEDNLNEFAQHYQPNPTATLLYGRYERRDWKENNTWMYIVYFPETWEFIFRFESEAYDSYFYLLR